MTVPTVTAVTPEMRGRIVDMWHSAPMTALINSLHLRHELLMREILQDCQTARHGISQSGIAGIPPANNGRFREAAQLLIAIEMIEREAKGPQIIHRLE